MFQEGIFNTFKKCNYYNALPLHITLTSCLDSISVLFSMCMSYYSLQVTIMLHDMIQFR